MNWNGFVVWRNNTMGVFDGAKAAKQVLVLVKSVLFTRKLPTLQDIRSLIARNYRKSHERKGVADIIGYQKKTGRFVSIEIKHGKDSLSPEQKAFLEQAGRNGGIAIVAKDMDGFLSEINKFAC
ncbi:MAG: VRR-NUC domain-containing protein [Phaeodactylibacter sp.]|nr:VRR-NUC domain-containing protein [Phaeodactylibacter sp.]